MAMAPIPRRSLRPGARDRSRALGLSPASTWHPSPCPWHRAPWKARRRASRRSACPGLAAPAPSRAAVRHYSGLPQQQRPARRSLPSWRRPTRLPGQAFRLLPVRREGSRSCLRARGARRSQEESGSSDQAEPLRRWPDGVPAAPPLWTERRSRQRRASLESAVAQQLEARARLPQDGAEAAGVAPPGFDGPVRPVLQGPRPRVRLALEDPGGRERVALAGEHRRARVGPEKPEVPPGVALERFPARAPVSPEKSEARAPLAPGLLVAPRQVARPAIPLLPVPVRPAQSPQPMARVRELELPRSARSDRRGRSPAGRKIGRASCRERV